MRMFGLDPLQRGVRKDGDSDIGQRADVVVQLFQGVRMQVNKIAGDMDSHQMATSVARVDVTGHESLDQQSADLHSFCLAHNDMPRAKYSRFGNCAL